MAAIRTSNSWKEGTYMRLINPDLLRRYVFSHDEWSAYRSSKAPLPIGKISQRKLAERAACSAGMINHFTSGRKASCDPPLALRIEEALNLPEGSLFAPETPSDNMQIAQSKVAA